MAAGKKIAVIGAGLGGLSAAIRLAYMGHSVHLFEQNSSPGGKAGSINAGGYRFDAGPSLLTMPFVLEELFRDVGDDIGSYLELKPLELLCKYFYPDKTAIRAYSDTDKFASEIQTSTKDSARQVKDYLAYCREIFELTSGLFLFNSFGEFSSLINNKGIKALFKLSRIDSFRTMDEANSTFFSDEKTIQIFNRYATYNGSNPFYAPATLNIIPHVEYNMGGYYTPGGIYSITVALEKLAEIKGVKIVYNSKVKRITTQGRRVTGIVVNGTIKEYDIVVSNADVYNTYHQLLKDDKSVFARRYKKLEPSSSALVFYWGVKDIHPELETNNILFSGSYKKEFEYIFKNRIVPVDPTVFIYISSRFNPSDAPANKENWFVMINTPYNDGQNWKDESNRAKEIILNKIYDMLGIELRDKIEVEKIMTPADIENKTGSFKGSIYGISSNSWSSAFFRQKNRSRKYKGLYFAGGSAHPGGGIPLVILSGKIAAELIQRYESAPRRVRKTVNRS